MGKIEKFSLILLRVFLIQLVVHGLLFSETRFVSHKGSAIPPYTTWETGCNDIQTCMNYCSSGDTIYLDRGIYKETVAFENKNIAIIGLSAEASLIDVSGMNGVYDANTLWWFNNSNLLLKNLTFKYNGGFTTGKIGIQVKHGTTNVSDCIFDSIFCALDVSGNCSIFNTSFHYVNSAVFLKRYEDNELIIDNCNFFVPYVSTTRPLICAATEQNGISNLYVYNSVFIKEFEGSEQLGIEFLSDDKIDIRNNFFSKFWIPILLESHSDGIKDTTTICNNTFYKNVYYAASLGNWKKERHFKNNIVVDGKWGIHSSTNYIVKVDYNLYYKISNSPYLHVYAGSHDVLRDPMFVNDTVAALQNINNFLLQKYSPAIDSGEPSVLDVDGTRSDMGMFGGPLGISYNYNDLPPKRITTIISEYLSSINSVKLNWDSCEASDFDKFKIYRGNRPDFAVNNLNLFSESTINTLTFPVSSLSKQKFYRITAVDSMGNESIPSDALGVSITGLDNVDISLNYNFELYQNFPNPFNPTTTIGYNLRDPGDVKIKLYDITGKLIKTVIAGEKDKGYNQTSLDMSLFASGIYLYRLEVIGKGNMPVFTDIKKMVLLK